MEFKAEAVLPSGSVFTEKLCIQSFLKMEVKTHRPKFHVGLNPTVHYLLSGFRPRGQYLEVMGLNPEVEKFDSGFRPRCLYIYKEKSHVIRCD